MHALGFLMRGELLWDKGSSASSSTAWGTYLKANNPVLRDVHEYILVFCKDTFTRLNPQKRKSTISKEEFLEFTKSVWKFPAERALKVGHPAPFPVELPYRTIQLYTFEGDVVLDPFVGSGTACIAALKTKRNYVAYDIDKNYCDLAEQRIKQFLTEKQQIEKTTAEKFIELYNKKFDTLFVVKKISDNPDVICEDLTGGELNLEITLTEDRPRDIKALLGRSEHKSLEYAKKYGLGPASSLSGNVSEQAYNRIGEKMVKNYGTNVALVVWDASPLDWNWDTETKNLAKKLLLKYSQNPFDKGVWILSAFQNKIFRVL